MEQDDIIKKFKDIFLHFPLKIDYNAEPTIVINQNDYKNIFDEDWILGRLRSDGWLKEEDRSPHDDAIFFIYNNVSNTLSRALERLLYRPLATSLIERIEHYKNHPNFIWSNFKPIDKSLPNKLLSKYSRTIKIPWQIPIDELPMLHHDCSTYDLELYCERVALKSILELCLITNPNNIFDDKNLLFDIFNPKKFSQALSIQPAIALTQQGRMYLSFCNYERNFPKSTSPKTEQKIRKETSKKGLPQRNVDMVALRRLLLIRALMPELTRTKFIFSKFQNAYLEIYHEGKASKYEELMPSERTLGPWVTAIWGERKRK